MHFTAPAHPVRRLLIPTPLDAARTEHVTNRRTQRAEIWRAYSADGTWIYQHEEDTGSSWSVLHIPTGRAWHGETSLIAARRGTASGWILHRLNESAA